MIAGVPRAQPALPAAVAARAAGRPAECVWVNETGGLTFRVGGTGGRGPVEYVKWAPDGGGLDLDAEAVRLEWAGRWTVVPRVVDRGRDDEGEWVATLPIDGDSAVAPRWLAEPRRAVTAIGRGLRALHDALPVDDCPFSWSAGRRSVVARELVADGARADPQGWNEDHRSFAVADLLAVLADPPTVDRLVVCHGDACAPNTLVADDGSVAGHVDLGALGVADRWADLAVATWSTRWNYGPGWEQVLLDAYGVEADPVRTRYHRVLWDLGP